MSLKCSAYLFQMALWVCIAHGSTGSFRSCRCWCMLLAMRVSRTQAPPNTLIVLRCLTWSGPWWSHQEIAWLWPCTSLVDWCSYQRIHRLDLLRWIGVHSSHHLSPCQYPQPSSCPLSVHLHPSEPFACHVRLPCLVSQVWALSSCWFTQPCSGSRLSSCCLSAANW